MFGMLDYRAHKLMWLLWLPIRLLVRIGFFVNVAASVLIAQSTNYSILAKILIAYVAFEGIGMVLLAFWWIVNWALQQVFFWVIDVVPSEGEDRSEAREVVLRGKVIRLVKKFTAHIDDWTYEDTSEFASVLNWRARAFFRARERLEKRIAILQRYHEDTGKQPQDIRADDLKKLVGHLEFNWPEKIFVNQMLFNSLFGGTIIIIALINMNHP